MVTRGEKLVQGLAGTAVWSVPELFGVEPPKYVQEFKQDNPVLGFGASMAVDLIPYAGWFAASKKIKSLDRIIEGLGNSTRAPIATGALREAARFAPLEAARVGGNALFGDQGFGDMIGSAAINTAFAGLGGGILGGLAAAGKRGRSITETLPELDEMAPVQLQLRSLSKMVPESASPGVDLSGAPLPLDPKIAVISARNSQLRGLVRGEDAPGGVYVQPLSKGDSSKLNTLFNAQEGALTKKGRVTQKFVEAEGQFRSDREWKQLLGGSGIDPTDFELYAQYPRRITTRTEEAAKRMQNTIRENMTDLGDGWHMAREAEDGMFVMARRNDKDASYTLFKTDSPDYFKKGNAQFGSAMVKANAWTRIGSENIDNAGPLFSAMANYEKHMSPSNYRLLEEKGDGLGMVDRIKGLAGIQKLDSKSNEAVGRIRDGLREYFTPTMFQTQGSPRATYILGTARMLRDSAESLAQQRMYGTFELDKTKNLISMSLGSRKSQKDGGLYQIIDQLDENDLKGLNKVFRDEPTAEGLTQMYANGEISDRAWSAATEMMKIGDEVGEEVLAAERAVGKTDFKKRSNYMMMSRQWDGDLRIKVTDQAGNLKGIASGYNNRDAEKNLQEMLRQNPTWKEAERFNISDQASGDGKGLPGWARARENIQGYRYNYRDFTKDDLVKEVGEALRRRYQHQANLVIDAKLKGEMDRLAIDNPLMHRIAQTRVNDLMGVSRPFAKAQNKLADKILGPIMGPNSASQIVAATNNLMWNLELGGFRLGYLALNLLTPIQTVLPEIAYVMNASPARSADFYSYFANMGTKGPVGTIGALDPIKLMTGTLRDMRKPGPDLMAAFERAVNERVIDPQIVEEFVGESATKVSDLRRAISGPGAFVDWTKALWQFLPAQTERFSRAYAFSAGYKVAKDMLGVIDEEDAFRFAKQFTSKTMYEYTQADRPSVMTGPAGSAMGLFKNWMMHYIGTMMDYTGEGVKHGNWAPLLWQQATTLGLGGLAASPLYVAASEANDWMSDKTLMENAYGALGQEGADSLFYGLPATMGISVSSQASSPLANPIRDAGMLFGAVHMDRIGYIAKSMGAAMDHWSATGQHPGDSEHVRELLVRTFAPKTIYRIVQSMGESGIESLGTGYPILPKAGMFDRLLFASGLNPTEIDRTYAVADILYRDQEKRRALIAAAGTAYNEAIEARDSQEAWLVLRGAMKQGLDASSVLKSAAGRNRAGNERMLDRTFDPQNVWKFRQVLGPD